MPYLPGKTHYGQLDPANESDNQEYWSKTYCGLEYHESPMTNRIEYVTCKRCKETYDKELERFNTGIVPKTNRYRNLHRRLRRKYGDAYCCENPDCLKTNTMFQWAIKPNTPYSMNRDDYQMLCKKCHNLQDAARGEKSGSSKLKEQDVIYIKTNPGNLTATELAKNYGVIR